MQKRMLRLFWRVLMMGLLLAWGTMSDAAFASVSQDDTIPLNGTDTAVEYRFTPATNGVYAGYLFSTGNLTVDHAVLYQGKTLMTYQEGGTKLFSVRLSTGTEYTLAIYGTGEGRIEISREALSRCFDQPLEMEEGSEYQKSIARSGDVHWYAVTPDADGIMLIGVMPDEKDVHLSAWLVSDSGEILLKSDNLKSGACFISTEITSGTQYRIRVTEKSGSTGKYTLHIQTGANAPKAEKILLSRSALSLNGKSRALIIASTLPSGSSGLMTFVSEDPEIAVIRKNGLIEGRSVGITNVLVYGYGGVTANCSVKVQPVSVESVSLTASQKELEVGQTLQLTASIQPSNALNRHVDYVSSDETVLQVDDRGVVTAIGVGTADITAANEDTGSMDSVTITVTEARTRYRALLIGEQNYASTAETVRVGSRHSVESMESLLKTARYSGTECEVTTLMDQSRDEVIAGIRETFQEASEKDVSIVYITCHGFYKAGMTFFLMADGSVLSASDLEKELRAIPGEIVLWADCCGSGGLLGAAGDQEKMVYGVTGVFQGAVGKTALGSSKYHVLASALLDQDSHRISFSGSDESDMATVFARAVCDALGWSIERNAQSAMNADTDYDGNVTFEEMTRYVSRRVQWYLQLAGGYSQNVVSGTSGDMFVVFSRTE